MFKEYLSFLIFIVHLLIQVESYVSASPTWLTSPYFRAGYQKIITSATGNSSKPAFTFTFSSALSGVPNLAYGVKNYRALDTLKNQKFQVRRQNLTASTFGVSIQAYNLSNIFNLAVAYLAIDPAFPHHLNSFDNVALNYSSPTLVQLTLFQTNFTALSLDATYHTEVINYTQQSALNKYKTFTSSLSSNKIVLFLTSFDVVCFGKETLQFSISTEILNSTHYSWTGRLFHNATISKVGFSQIVYNEDDVTASKVYAIVNQEWNVLNPGGYQSFPQQLVDNMIMALTDFQTTLGQCGFQYNWDFMSNYNTLPYALLITNSTPSSKPPYVSAAKCGLNYTRSTLFYIKTWKCGAPYVYFNLTTDLCQDACANYFYENVTASTCDACYYSCFDCTQGGSAKACTQCEAGLNRTLVNGSCLCASGYFDDWYSPTCRACTAVDSHCQTCTYASDPLKTSADYTTTFSVASWPNDILPDFKCTLCAATYFVNSSYLCQSCPITHCTLCSNLTACNTCDSSVNATKYTDNLCYLCNIANCAMCSADNVCAQCQAGYNLNLGICLSCALGCDCGGWVLPMVNGDCSTLCGDGYRLGGEECDDGNTVDHDGCSSTCMNETCDVSCVCDGWVAPWVSGSCSTLCGDGYTRGSQQCDDNNTNDHDGCSSTCQSEPCNVSCQCDGWVLPWVNGSCTTVCGDGFARGTENCDDGNTLDYDGCSSICQSQGCNLSCTCDGWTFPWFNGSCTPICGDNLLRGTQECDDGNTNDHDGCSSICKNEACDVSCQCGGWTLPWANVSCTAIPVCGNSLVQGTETCDDGNLLDHDGCSSTCQSEPCNVSCQCDGWVLPWVNGSCSTVCGDGFIRGIEQCDDSNLLDGDQCTANCTLPFIPLAEDPVLLTSEMSTYPALLLFIMGFRIVGLEALNVIQSFQLLLHSYNVESFVLSFNVHGYTDSEHFPIQIPAQSHIFTYFNFTYLLVIAMFVIGAGLEIYHKSCYSTNKVVDDFEVKEQIDPKDQNINKNQVEIGSSYSHSEEIGDFTVHYKHQEHQIQHKSENSNPSQHNSHNSDEESQQIPFWGNILFRQVFFDLVINTQCIFVYSLVLQFKNDSLNSFLNFSTITLIVTMIFILAVVLAVCITETYSFGENNLKFHNNQAILYWVLIIGEKILLSTVLAYRSDWSLYAALGIKFILVLYYCFANLYFERIQKIRSVFTHMLHLLLILAFTLNEKIFKPQETLVNISPLFMEFIYCGLLGAVLITCFGFYVRELMYSCSADFRNSQSTANLANLVTVNGTVNAVFDSKQCDAMEQSAHPFNASTAQNSNIFDDLRTKQLLPQSFKTTSNLSEIEYLGGALPKKIISINNLSPLNSPGTTLQEPSAVTKQSFLTQRKSHLKTKKMNIFDNLTNQQPEEILLQSEVKSREENKQNQNVNKHNQEKRISLEQRLVEDGLQQNQTVAAFAKDNGLKKARRMVGLKNKRQSKGQYFESVIQTQDKQQKTSFDLSNVSQQLPNYSTTQNILNHQPKQSKEQKKKILTKKKNRYVKKVVQNLEIQNRENQASEPLEKIQYHDSYDDVVQIGLE